jgi:broad specificity phosphatase PhoE
MQNNTQTAEEESAKVVGEADFGHHHIFFVRHGERADHAKHLKIEYPF